MMKKTSKRLVPRNLYAIAKSGYEFTDIIFPNFAKRGHQYGDAILNAVISRANFCKKPKFDLKIGELEKAVRFRDTKHKSFPTLLKMMFLDTNSNLAWQNGKEWKVVTLLSDVTYDPRHKKVHVELNPKAIPYFIQFNKPYNKLLTYDLAVLGNNYPAKALYRILRLYRRFGHTKVYLLSDIIKRFQVPTSYQKRPNLIKTRVFQRAIEALEKHKMFTNIKACKVDDPAKLRDSKVAKRKAGGQKILGYYFTFKPLKDGLEVENTRVSHKKLRKEEVRVIDMDEQVKATNQWIHNLRLERQKAKSQDAKKALTESILIMQGSLSSSSRSDQLKNADRKGSTTNNLYESSNKRKSKATRDRNKKPKKTTKDNINHRNPRFLL